MKKFRVILTGTSPLIMHHDNIEWADFMEEWKNNPANKQPSKPGDDRTPAWRWLGCVYHNGSHVVIPQSNVMKAIMEGGALVPVPGGRSGKTFKSQTQSGMMTEQHYWYLEVNGAPVKWADIEPLKDQPLFAEHVKKCRELGFDLLVKRAKIGQAKHVRVRPVFPSGWTVTGTLLVWDEQITQTALESILSYTGRYKGLGDWRPGSKTPGPYGTFQAEITALD